MTKSRGIMGPRKPWTDEDLVHLRSMYPDTKTEVIAASLGRNLCVVYGMAKRLGLRKSQDFLSGPQSGRLDGVRGSKTRFQKANVPWTAGAKGIRLSMATEFKKGHVPANVMEVGALRINSMGDIDIKVAPGMGNWVSLRRFCWEQENGPIPPDMCVIVLNGDPHDTRLENLRLVDRAENVRHNLHRKYPKELRTLWQLGGRLKTQISKLEGHSHD